MVLGRHIARRLAAGGQPWSACSTFWLCPAFDGAQRVDLLPGTTRAYLGDCAPPCQL